MCIAKCLDLTDAGEEDEITAEHCNFNPSSGLATGKACTKKFYFNERNYKTVLCSIMTNPDGTFLEFDLLSLVKSRECTHISISPLLIFNQTTNSLDENLPAIQELEGAIRLGSIFKTKILLEIGTWDDFIMSPESLSKVAASQALRSKFSNEVQRFVRKLGLDGVFISWQYPTCPKHTCNPGVPQDRANLISLMESLKSALPPSQKMILLSLPPYPDALKGFNFPALEPLIDLFAIYSFNYGFHSIPVVKQNSPLLDQKSIVEAIVAKQGSISKLIIGISGNIEYFVLTDKNSNKVGAPHQMFKGSWIPFGEGCRRVRNNSYTIVKDAYASNYATLNTEWFSFEDYASLERKAEYVKRNQIAGMWIKNEASDDYSNECGCGTRPLTRMLAELLRAEGGCTYTNCP